MSADPMRPSDWWIVLICVAALAVVWFSVFTALTP